MLNAIKGHHPSIGACADLGHYIRSGEDPVRAITLLAGRLYGVHLKDFAEPKKDAAGVILGRGQLDVAATFRACARPNFRPTPAWPWSTRRSRKIRSTTSGNAWRPRPQGPSSHALNERAELPGNF